MRITGKYARVHPATLAKVIDLLGNYRTDLNAKLWNTESPNLAAALEAEKREVSEVMARLWRAEDKSLSSEERAMSRQLPSEEAGHGRP